MSNIKNLTLKILKDADIKKEEILNKAYEDEKIIIDKKIKEAKEKEKEIIQKAKKEGMYKKERIISNSQIKIRNEKLKSKQTIISHVLEKALNDLCSLNDEKYLSYIQNSILSFDIFGDEKLILNEKDKNKFGEKILSDINKKLNNNGNIVISDKTGNFQGGFILEREGIEINNTFEALIDSIKDELEYKIAKILFD